MNPKSIFDTFYDICYGRNEYQEPYNKDAINNLFSNYRDTIDMASFLATKGRYLPPEKHYDICQLYVKKGQRYRPTYIKAKKDID